MIAINNDQAAQSPVTPGFGVNPFRIETRYIFIGKCAAYPWFSLSSDNVQVPIAEEALVCRLTKIYWKQALRQGKPSWKFYLVAAGDCRYICEAGYGTYFARSLCLAINRMSDAEVGQWVALVPKAVKNQPTIIYANLYNRAGAVEIEYPKHKQRDTKFWNQVIQTAQTKLEAIN